MDEGLFLPSDFLVIVYIAYSLGESSIFLEEMRGMKGLEMRGMGIFFNS